ncbi:hypothetical protein JCGZ_12428 [Jatropha curcas]|uniref:Filament-like plant protein 7 n=1 Tax=Jatropha curcas TaxID=180498 RepID=A0A067K776_JATCU|nr:filament-like plant protein 7 [Jatropha curcas]KDP31967.1 hypothetical protein JCGZ_12428 [Jatropha curcas]
MDQKPWLWRKKSTEKMIVANDKINLSPKGNQEELQTLLSDKAELEKDLKSLNDKLSSALSECDAKEDLAKKQAKIAEEAMAAWEKAEVIAVSLKQELDEALQQRIAGEERLSHLDAALKECMQQLRFVREEQEQRIHDAVTKASAEFEKSQIVLEEKLADSSKRLAKIGVENTHLSKALMTKEKLIEDLSKQKAQMELDFNALMTRLESTEKENSSLKYEVRVLEKELEIRNEEREFNRRAADASHKQQLESAKKIAKLESECQRLRLLVRKRLPGPAALAKMKSEVDILGRDSIEMRRRRTNSSPTGLIIDLEVENSLETPSKKVNFLTDHLYALEEENGTLREALNKKANELQLSRTMYAHTASKLSQVESHLDELSKVQTTLEPSRTVLAPHELCLTSMSDVGSDDKVSCAESWASALISELEHFKHGKQRGSPSGKTVGASDINLMDDFVEMERLAIVSADKQSGTGNAKATINALETSLNGYSSQVTCREIIPVLDSGLGVSNQEIESKDLLIGKAPDCIQDNLKVPLEQTHTPQRKPDRILDDVRVALAELSNRNSTGYGNTRESPKHLDASDSPHAGGDISLNSTDKSLPVDSSPVMNDVDILLTVGNDQQVHSDLGKSLHKIIEHVERITLPIYGTSETSSGKNGNFLPYKNVETSSGYMVRVFQWKTSELSVVLQEFIHACYDLLNGNSDVNRFTQELSSALDWIINHCFSLQDVSSMRDAIQKHLDWDETQSESEVEVGMISQFPEVHKLGLPQEQFSFLPKAAASNEHNNCSEKDEFRSNIRDENKRLKDELISVESIKKELEARLQLATDQSESLMNKLQESEETIASLQKELETLKMSKESIENRSENHRLMKEDLDTQLTAAKAELNEACHKFASLEVELENKNGCCEELEATCLELQLQLESITKKEIPNHELHQEETKLRTDWEITAASEKLAECQETILNLGKQLKALAAPSEAVLFDKAMSSSSDTNAASATTGSSTDTALTAARKKLMNQRSSLIDQMLAEDNAETKVNESLKIKERDENSSTFDSKGVIEPLENILILNGTKSQDGDAAVNSLAIVPSKKQGGKSLWRKLFWRKKKSNSKKPPLPFAP